MGSPVDVKTRALTNLLVGVSYPLVGLVTDALENAFTELFDVVFHRMFDRNLEWFTEHHTEGGESSAHTGMAVTVWLAVYSTEFRRRRDHLVALEIADEASAAVLGIDLSLYDGFEGGT